MAVGGVTSPGPGVGEIARRLGVCFHALRELVHGSCRFLAIEPRLEVKYALTDQIHDDARSARAVSRRLAELRPPLDSNHPGPALGALLDSLAGARSPDEYLSLAYGEVKPRLAATVEELLSRLDPWLDEPSLRALIELRHRQAYHLADCPVALPRTVAGAPALPHELTAGRRRPLFVASAVEHPARDPFVAVVDVASGAPAGAALLDALSSPDGTRTGDRGVLSRSAAGHALMHQRLSWAEVAARTSHEHPELPGAFHVDMAKLAWDAARHAQALERLLGGRGHGHWGQHPVARADFLALYRPALRDRLEAMEESARLRLAWRAALWTRRAPRADAEVVETLDFLLADEQDHVECLAAWRPRI